MAIIVPCHDKPIMSARMFGCQLLARDCMRGLLLRLLLFFLHLPHSWVSANSRKPCPNCWSNTPHRVHPNSLQCEVREMHLSQSLHTSITSRTGIWTTFLDIIYAALLKYIINCYIWSLHCMAVQGGHISAFLNQVLYQISYLNWTLMITRHITAKNIFAVPYIMTPR